MLLLKIFQYKITRSGMQSQVLVTNYVDKPSNIINILHSLYTELLEYPIICL